MLYIGGTQKLNLAKLMILSGFYWCHTHICRRSCHNIAYTQSELQAAALKEAPIMIAQKRKLFFSVLFYTQSTKRAHLPALQHSCSHLLKPGGLLLFTFFTPCPKAELQGVEPGLLRQPRTNGPQAVLGCNIQLPHNKGMSCAVLLAALQHGCDGKPVQAQRGPVSMMKCWVPIASARLLSQTHGLPLWSTSPAVLVNTCPVHSVVYVSLVHAVHVTHTKSVWALIQHGDVDATLTC